MALRRLGLRWGLRHCRRSSTQLQGRRQRGGSKRRIKRRRWRLPLQAHAICSWGVNSKQQRIGWPSSSSRSGARNLGVLAPGMRVQRLPPPPPGSRGAGAPAGFRPPWASQTQTLAGFPAAGRASWQRWQARRQPRPFEGLERSRKYPLQGGQGCPRNCRRTPSSSLRPGGNAPGPDVAVTAARVGPFTSPLAGAAATQHEAQAARA